MRNENKLMALNLSILFALCFVFIGCTWTLDKAIVTGYTNAGLDDSSDDIVRLSDNDYNEICAKFDEDTVLYHESNTRWEYIERIIIENFGEEKIKRVDKTQWLGGPKPLAIDVYLDNTSSMKGYINHDHENNKTFVNVFHAIDDFRFRCSEQEIATDTIRGYYTQRNKSTKSDEIVYFAWSTMKNQLDQNRINAFTDSYQLDNFLDHIVSRMETDFDYRHLSFFITDGIPSGFNEEVTGTKWNLNQTDELKNRIRTIAKRMSKNNFGISIYQFDGHFYNGKYWYYDNDSKDVTERNKMVRPFYVIVLGNIEVVDLFKTEVKKHLKLFEPKNNNQLHFANAVEEVSMQVRCDGQIANESNEGDFELDADGKEFVNVSISIPIGALPFSMHDSETLGKAITLKIEGVQRDATPKIKDDQVVFENIKMQKMFNHIEIDVKNIIPQWAIDINVPDDKAQNWDYKGTFNFIVLAEGLKEGFSGNEDYVFDKIKETIKINNLKQ